MKVTSRVANQDTHEVVTLAIDQRTGLLRPTGHARRVAVPNSICCVARGAGSGPARPSL
jgi:hypothetical protein